MATYFHGSSEIQADGLQTLYLMNPNYVGFSDTPPPANMLFLNPAGNALNPANLSHAPPPPTQHFVGIPLPGPSHFGSASSDDPSRQSAHAHHDFPAAAHGILPRFQYNLWGSTDQSTAGSHIQVPGAAADVAQFGFRRLAPPHPSQQGLSLSLNSPQQSAGYRSLAVEHDVSSQGPVPAISPGSGEDLRVSAGNSSPSASAVSNGICGMQSVLLSSKYLKAAQQLLDEVVNVGKAIKTEEGTKEKMKMNKESVGVVGDGAGGGGEGGAKRGADLSTAQRQELQMKKAKLINMLDEVEQRYRQYHHQMQIVVSSFEQAAGFGSAKSYTALALQTISKQFRCLKDAIAAQIKATSKSLGEEECLGAKVEGSRLKLVDHHLRQQRALQQLGMIQHNAWRPQRGLPERAVSVLRAWLFEHFLHPYPKDSDKIMLAKQTGLTRSQVSNWFINARVRLWKPMVEEMYREEIKDQEQNNLGSENNAGKSEPNKDSASKCSAPLETCTIRTDQTKKLQSNHEKPANQSTSPTEISNSTMSTAPIFGGPLQGQSAGFTHISASSDLEGIIQRSPKKPRSSDMQNSPSSIISMDMDMKSGDHTTARDGYSLMTPGTTSHGSGFSACSVGEIGPFSAEQLGSRLYGNSVSLTLGLTHCDSLSLSGAQQNFISNQNIQLGRRLEMGTGEPDFCSLIAPQPSHSNTAGFQNINVHDRKRFAAQLLPDFVA